MPWEGGCRQGNSKHSPPPAATFHPSVPTPQHWHSIPAAQAGLGDPGTGHGRGPLRLGCHHSVPKSSLAAHCLLRGITHGLTSSRCPLPRSPTPCGRQRHGHLRTISPRPLISLRCGSGKRGQLLLPPILSPRSSKGWTWGGGTEARYTPSPIWGDAEGLDALPGMEGTPGMGHPPPEATGAP